MNTAFKNLPQIVTVVGGQWGDEGKGKLIDIMSPGFDIVVRPTGGANAGHTVYIPDIFNEGKIKKFVFHLLPSGMLSENTICIIGNGCVIHLPTLFEELTILEQHNINIKNRIFISDRAHLVLEYHKIIDRLIEEKKGKGRIGTTGRGIGPAYQDKVARMGLRLGDIRNMETFDIKLNTHARELSRMYDFDFNIEQETEYLHSQLSQINPLLIDTANYLNKAIKSGKKILIEGANGTLLDVDHGTYPYVTSTNTTIGGIISGSGIGARYIQNTIGVMKAYTTRVGEGPFPTELKNELGNELRTIGGEFGSTTGRPRRCGWFDAVAARYSAAINGFTSINLTKLDVLDNLETICIGTKYVYKGQELEYFPSSLDELNGIEVVYEELPGWKTKISNCRKIIDLPPKALAYIKRIEELLECPVNYVGVGVDREQLATV